LQDDSRVPCTDRSPFSDRLVEMVGEAIKDTVLDLGADGRRNLPPVVDPLPPVSQTRFIKTMRPVVVAVLRKTADFINESPDQRFVTSEDQRINRIFLRLIQKALQVGVEMRADAAEPKFKFKTGRYPYSTAPLTKWARRYRLMAVGGPEWQPPGAFRGRRAPV